MAKAVSLLLDSGAFSAWKKGEQINLGEYIEFVKEHRSLLHAYVNLDVIPGRLGGKPAEPPEVEEAAAQSWRNFEAMRTAGLDPIPVYHLGESADWLRRILDSGAGWIGLGGAVGKPDEAQHRFFKRSFRLISAAPRPPRVHGFGVTSINHLVNFPWYSADSTSWVISSAMGAIFVPTDSRDGGFDFSKLSLMRVSGRGSQARQAGNYAGDLYRTRVEKFLAGEGCSLVEVCNNQYSRNFINARALTEMARVIGFRLFFSTWLGAGWHQGPQLTEARARSRLISYYEICGRPDRTAHLAEYVARGFLSSDREDLDRGRPGTAAYRGRRVAALMARLAQSEADV